jgi:hypothetical protein
MRDERFIPLASCDPLDNKVWIAERDSWRMHVHRGVYGLPAFLGRSRWLCSYADWELDV